MDAGSSREPTVGELVRRYRDRKGWSQAVLAKKAGVSAKTIFNLEGDHRAPQLPTIKKVADALRLPALERAALEAARQRRGSDSVVDTAPAPSQPEAAVAPAEARSPARMARERRPLVLATGALLVAAVVTAGLLTGSPAGDNADERGHSPGPTPTGLGGLWISPEPNFVVQDQQLGFAARGMRATPFRPPVAYVHFTVAWSGAGGGWHSACAAEWVKPGTSDTYECVWTLPPDVPNGAITVSFDVYDEAGNYTKAPHGKRKGTVRGRV